MSGNQSDIVRIEPKASIKIDFIQPIGNTTFDELVAKVMSGKWKMKPGFKCGPSGTIAFGDIMVYEEIESGS